MKAKHPFDSPPLLLEILQILLQVNLIVAQLEPVKKKADINAPNIRGERPLHYACIYGYAHMVEALIQLKVDVNVM